MIKYIILPLVLLCSIPSYGQEFDDFISDAYQSLNEGEIDKASELVQSATHQINGNDKLSQGKLQVLLANINWHKRDFSQSIIHYQQAIDMLLSVNMNSMTPYAYQGLGLCYKTIGDYQKSLSSYLSALKQFEIDQKEKEIAQTKYLLANLYLKLNQYDKALSLYNDLLIYHKDAVQLAKIHNSIGSYHYFMKDYKQAIAFYFRALKLVEPHHHKSLGIYTHNIGDTFIKLGKLDSALYYLNKSLKLRQQTNKKESIAKSYINLGRVYVKKQFWKKAYEYLTLAKVLTSELNELPLHKELYEVWIEYAKGIGDLASAVQYSEKLIMVKDSLLNKDRINAIALLEVRYETEKKEAELEASFVREQIQEESLSYQKYTIITLASVVILLLVISFLIYRLFLQNKKEKKEIMWRMREQHHRIENNISVLSSILSLAAKETKSDEARILAKDGENRLNAINLLHKELYWDENQVAIQLDRYVNTLSEYLLSVFMKPIINENPLVLNLDAINLDVKIAIPLSLILNEVITNAFKHGMDNRHPKLLISLSVLKNKLSLVVEDNGNGLSMKKKNHPSFGIQLIHSLVKQIHGELNINSNKNGTRIELLAPI